MAETSTFHAKTRTRLGSRSCRKLRSAGQIPGNIYGHERDPVAISVDGDTLTKAVHSGHRIVDVNVDGKIEKTMFRDVQWNTYATEILHFDLLRIVADERVVVSVPIELQGMSPGVTSGGVMDQVIHEIEMEVLAVEIPDSLVLRVSDMEIGDSRTLADLELPAGAQVELPEDAVIAQVNEPREVPEEEMGEEEGVPAEPELVGREEEEESEGEED